MRQTKTLGETKAQIQQKMNDRLLTLREFSSLLSLSTRTIRRLIAKGELPQPVKVGGATRMYLSDADKFLHKLKEGRANG